MEVATTFEGEPKQLAELFTAIAAAQSEMGKAIKDSTNPHFKSKYADLASVCDAVMPSLNKNGIAVMQCPSMAGNKVCIETILAHKGGGIMRSILELSPTKADPQGVGSAITYGRRYALQAISGISAEDDDGNAASAPQSPPASVKLAAESREFFTRIVNMVRTASDTDQLESLYRAHKGEIDADRFRADILKEFGERRAELEAVQ